ncbi:hypothetical protein [Anabaena catenula]|uniref:Uncharacterized protein n=1 Tax=Anabaena catenula FACHB-362 TaxID=2692877 RepID=A0ABR8IY93_9NOST|nr:hypothetical protein [Anabaena catenula]MBD2691060.1 hypothetical protein [Anabaena catenula FACHB-362]
MNLSQGFWKKSMSKIIYDVIQRFEVENGVPRLVSTNIQVIEGGEDLLSLAISLLTKLGFYEKFEEKRTSQYIGYRLKNPGKGAKRYQLVFAQRKEGLCISIPKDVLKSEILNLVYLTEDMDTLRDEFGKDMYNYHTTIRSSKFWILPNKKDIFLKAMEYYYPNILNSEVKGNFCLNPNVNFLWTESIYGEALPIKPEGFELEQLEEISSYITLCPQDKLLPEEINSYHSYLILYEDNLFPYMSQVCITSKEVLEEFITHFAKILMEKN